MTARRRTVLLVVLLAAVAAGVAAAAVLASQDGGASDAAPSVETGPRAGAPPLSLDLGFRTDPEARDLAKAARLYTAGNRARAAAIFARHDSLEAKVGAAFGHWPDESVARMEQLAGLYPKSGVVLLHLGLARFWARQGDPAPAWRQVVDVQPDSTYAVLAGTLLHPELARGLPGFVPGFSASKAITSLAAGRQLGALRAAAATGGVRERLLYGVGLQRVGRPVSAARVFAETARRYPENAEAQVAAAVGLFDKDQPEIAFGRLGPLTRRFPSEPTVRFHLGLLLLWTGRLDEAERQLRRAERTRPNTPIAREAARYLDVVRKAREGG